MHPNKWMHKKHIIVAMASYFAVDRRER